MTTGFNVFAIALCIFFQAFFSGSEMILLSSNKIRLKRKSKKGSHSAKIAVNMIENPGWFLATTSTGTNMAVVVASVIAAVWFHQILGTYGELGTILILSPILLMFGEVIPRSVFQQRATELAPVIAPVLLAASYLISPVTLLVYSISKLFYTDSEKKALEKGGIVTREELELSLKIPIDGSDVQKKEKKLIQQIFMLSKAVANDTMIPLVDVSAIPITSTMKDAVEIIRKTGYSRIPVYKDRIVNIVGIVRAFDIINVADGTIPIKRYVREVPYIPEFKKIDKLLIFMQRTRNSISIVVDEYGGSTGIITVEDILEEVVGEIRDEYDKVATDLIRLAKNKFRVSARMEIDQLNEHLNINIPKENYETLGGFILKEMGKIPHPGEVLLWNSLKFKITRATKRSVSEIIIELNEKLTS